MSVALPVMVAVPASMAKEPGLVKVAKPPPIPVLVKSPSPDLTRLPAFSKLPAGPPPLRKRVVAPASAAISRMAPGALRKTAPLLKRRSAPLLRTLAPELLVWVRVRRSMVVEPLMVRGPASSTGPLPARVPPEKERPAVKGTSRLRSRLPPLICRSGRL